MAVHLVERQAELMHELSQMVGLAEVVGLLAEQVGERGAVHVVHHHAALVGSVGQLVIAYDVVGPQRRAQLILLAQHLAVEVLLQVFGPQRLQEIVAAVTTYLVEDMVAAASV